MRTRKSSCQQILYHYLVGYLFISYLFENKSGIGQVDDQTNVLSFSPRILVLYFNNDNERQLCKKVNRAQLRKNSFH